MFLLVARPSGQLTLCILLEQARNTSEVSFHVVIAQTLSDSWMRDHEIQSPPTLEPHGEGARLGLLPQQATSVGLLRGDCLPPLTVSNYRDFEGPRIDPTFKCRASNIVQVRG
jgi:hypothetical protein